jgi:osmotically-inducible protein OsmY
VWHAAKDGFLMTDRVLVDVESRVQTALAASPVYALRELRVERHGTSLHLHGLVPSYYYKQLAQEVVRSIAGNFEVINSIAVREALTG